MLPAITSANHNAAPGTPSLRVREPEGNEYTIYLKNFLEGNLEQRRVTLGRNSDNDIPRSYSYKMISRYHCSLEYANGRWWLQDSGSANGTFVRPSNGNAEIDVRLEESVPLKNGDEILILGKMTVSNDPVFWRLTFWDTDETFQVKKLQTHADFEYSLPQQRLFRVTQRERDEVKLSPQERKFIQYMAQRNQDNNQPVVCSYEELMQAIWDETFSHTSNEVNRIGWSVRNKIELDSGEPRFLKTVKGSGYLLDIKIIS